MCIGTIIGTILSIATNILVGAWGIMMLVIGVMVMTTPKKIFSFFSELQNFPENAFEGLIDPKVVFASHAATLIILGLIVIAVSIFGFCCGQCGKLCRLVYVVGLVALVSIVSLLLIILTTTVGKDILKEGLQRGLNETYSKYLQNPETVDANGVITPPMLKDAGLIKSRNDYSVWFNYQSITQCCGVVGNFSSFNSSSVLPASCCQLTIQKTLPTNTKQYNNYQACIGASPKGEYANILGCAEPILGSLLMSVQMVQLGLLIALILLVGSLTCAVFLLGD